MPTTREYLHLGSIDLNDNNFGSGTWTLVDLVEEMPQRKTIWSGEQSPFREGRFPTSDVADNKRFTIIANFTATDAEAMQAARSALFQELAKAEDPYDTLYLYYRPSGDHSWTEIRQIRVLSVMRCTPTDNKMWFARNVEVQIAVECEPAWRGTVQTLESLLIGGSFEIDSDLDGIGNGWSEYAGTLSAPPTTVTLSTTYKKYGRSSQYVKAPASATAVGIKSLPVAVLPATQYTIVASVFHNGNGSGGAGDNVEVQIWDLSHSYTQVLTTTMVWSKNTGMEEKEYAFTTPAGTYYIQILVLRPSAASILTEWYVDGIYLEARGDTPPARLFQHTQYLAPDTTDGGALWSSFSVEGVLGDIDPLFNFAVENLSDNNYNEFYASIIRAPSSLTYTPLRLCYDTQGNDADTGAEENIDDVHEETAITQGAAYANIGVISVTTETTQRPYQCFVKLKATVATEFYVKMLAQSGAELVSEKVVSVGTSWALHDLGVIDWPPHKQDQVLDAYETASITLQARSDLATSTIWTNYVLFMPADGFFAVRDPVNKWGLDMDENSRLRVGNITFLRPIASGYLYAAQPPELRGIPVLHNRSNIGYLWIKTTGLTDNASHGLGLGNFDRRHRIKIIYYPRYL